MLELPCGEHILVHLILPSFVEPVPDLNIWQYMCWIKYFVYFLFDNIFKLNIEKKEGYIEPLACCLITETSASNGTAPIKNLHRSSSSVNN